jgi:DNA-3-methyladenine glycosylase II
METLQIEPRPPFSFERTIRRLFHLQKSGYFVRKGNLYRTLRAKGRPFVVEIGWREPSLLFRIHQAVTPEERRELEEQLRRMFSADVDLTPFYRRADQDELLAPVVREREGLRPVLDPTLYECLIKTIISQQLNLSFAGTLIDRLMRLAGERVEFEGESVCAFPTPDRVAALSYEDLTRLQFNRRKAEYVIDISRMVAEGRLNLEGLRRRSDEEVMEILLPLRGIGRWTVECLLLFGMGRPDLLPAADIGLRRAVQKVYGLAERPGEKEVRRIGEAWAPWRSYATFYLWDAITGGKEG